MINIALGIILLAVCVGLVVDGINTTRYLKRLRKEMEGSIRAGEEKCGLCRFLRG